MRANTRGRPPEDTASSTAHEAREGGRAAKANPTPHPRARRDRRRETRRPQRPASRRAKPPAHGAHGWEDRFSSIPKQTLRQGKGSRHHPSARCFRSWYFTCSYVIFLPYHALDPRWIRVENALDRRRSRAGKSPNPRWIRTRCAAHGACKRSTHLGSRVMHPCGKRKISPKRCMSCNAGQTRRSSMRQSSATLATLMKKGA